ncbi:hypothetical protein ACIP88_09055 [Streptomyces uncialis]
MTGSKEYSISLPEDLAEAVRPHVGLGGFREAGSRRTWTASPRRPATPS